MSSGSARPQPSTRAGRLLAEALRVQPAPGAGRVAARAASCVLLALLLLWRLDHLDWALYATFGAFASLYGGRSPRPGRWRTQAFAGLLLIAAVASGAVVATSAERQLLVVPVAAAWAAAAAALSDRHAWRPPGPMFFVFAVGACASVPTSGGEVPVVVAVSAATALLATSLGAAETALARRWPREPGPAPAAAPAPRARPRRAVHVVRCAAVVAVAGALTVAGGVGHPYWAMVAAVVPLAGATLSAQVVRGAQRAVGTLVGLLGAALLLSLDLPTLAVVLLIAALQGAAELLVARNYGAALLFITPLALLSGQLAAPRPVATLITDRVVETSIGVAIGLAGAVLTRPRRSPVADGAPPDRR